MKEAASPEGFSATFADAERSLLADLLERSRLYHTSKDYLELLDFVSRLRNFAPFNAMLLQIQRPGLTYAASEYDWRTRFDRTIKEDARPLLILWPFGPVAFVYDKEDTEGADLPVDMEQMFHAAGAVSEEDLTRFAQRLDNRGVHVERLDYGDGKAGSIKVVRRSTNKKERPSYQVRMNRNHTFAVQFVTLVHELGHLFLGHLGPDEYLKIARRLSLKPAEEELEAESLAYLVCKRHGVASKSESYLADYVTANTATGSLDLDNLFKAAGQVETVLGISAQTRFEPKPRTERKASSARLANHSRP